MKLFRLICLLFISLALITSVPVYAQLDREGLLQKLEDLSPLLESKGKSKKKKFTLAVYKAIGEEYQQRLLDLKYRGSKIVGYLCVDLMPKDIAKTDDVCVDENSQRYTFSDFTFENAVINHRNYINRMKWEIAFVEATGISEDALNFITALISTSPFYPKVLGENQTPLDTTPEFERTPRTLVWGQVKTMQTVYDLNSHIDFSTWEKPQLFSDKYRDLISDRLNMFKISKQGFS